MADTVHLYLKLDGADVPGESSQTSLGRANSIECFALGFDVERVDDDLVGGDIRVVARIDKATAPILAGIGAQKTAAAVFKFFRPSPTGDGTTEQFYTVEGAGGRVASVSQWVPNVLDPASSSYPPQVQYTLSFPQITATYTSNGSSATLEF